ncbi:MAG TPA: hypothetical protein VIG99_28250 [Myxococcaceae bacterium]
MTSRVSCPGVGRGKKSTTDTKRVEPARGRSGLHRAPPEHPEENAVRTIRTAQGETVRSVAERFRQSVRTVEVANALPRQAVLKTGAWLMIPAGHRTMDREALMEVHRRDLLDRLAMIQFVAGDSNRAVERTGARATAVVALEVGLKCYSRLFPESLDEDTRARISRDARALLRPGPISEVLVDRIYAELSQLPRSGDVVALGRWVDAQLEAKTAKLLDAWSYPPAFEKMKRDAAVNREFIGLYLVAAGADDFYVAVIESPPQRSGISARVAYDAAGTLLATGDRRYVREQRAWEPAFSWRSPR